MHLNPGKGLKQTTVIPGFECSVTLVFPLPALSGRERRRRLQSVGPFPPRVPIDGGGEDGPALRKNVPVVRTHELPFIPRNQIVIGLP